MDSELILFLKNSLNSLFMLDTISPSPETTKYNYNVAYFEKGMNGWHKQSYHVITSKFKETLKDISNKSKILDFGCGDGFYGGFLKMYANSLYGMDISDSIEASKNLTNYTGFYQNDLGKQITHALKYDILFSSEVIEHVEDYQTFIKNASHLLNNHGTIFLTTTTFSCSLPIYLTSNIMRIKLKEIILFVKGWMGDYNSRTSFLKNIWGWTKGHHHGFSKKQLAKAFMDNGFEVLSIEYIFVQPFIYEDFFKNPFKSSK